MDHAMFGKYSKKKKKRKRTVISAEEIYRLEKEFSKDPRPDRMTKIELGREMGKPENVISTWFQNRRAREKKMARMRSARDNISGTGERREAGWDVDLQPLNLSLKDSGLRNRSYIDRAEGCQIDSGKVDIT